MALYRGLWAITRRIPGRLAPPSSRAATRSHTQAAELFLQQAMPLLNQCYTTAHAAVARTPAAQTHSEALHRLVELYFQTTPFTHDSTHSCNPHLLSLMADQFGHPSARIFILNSLTNCVLQNDPVTFGSIVDGLARMHKLPPAAREIFDTEEGDLFALDPMTFVTTLALALNEPLLATAMFFKLGVRSASITTMLVEALLVPDPKYDEYTLDALVKLISTQELTLSHEQVMGLLAKLEATGEAPNPTFIHKLDALVINNLLGYLGSLPLVSSAGPTLSIETSPLTPAVLQHTYTFLRRQMGYFNNGCVYLLWLKIKPLVPLVSHDLEFLNELLKFLGKQRVYHPYVGTLVRELPVEMYAHPVLVETLLHHAARTLDQKLLQEILVQLKLRGETLARPTLSGLLHANLVFNNTAMTEKILLEIFAAPGGLQFYELNMLIRSLLLQSEAEGGGLQKAVEMCEGVSVELAKSAYVTILSHMVDTKAIDRTFVAGMMDRFAALPADDLARDHLMGVYFKYLVNAFPLLVARKVFTNSFRSASNPPNRSPFVSPPATPPFLSPPSEIARTCDTLSLVIPPYLKFFLLTTILDKARTQGNWGVMRWGLFELYNDGVAPMEVLVDWSKRYGSWFRKLGFKRLPLKKQFAGSDEYEVKLVSYWADTGVADLEALMATPPKQKAD